MMIFSLKPLFWIKKDVIWRLFNDNLRVREREEKEPEISRPSPFSLNYSFDQEMIPQMAFAIIAVKLCSLYVAVVLCYVAKI